MSPLYDFVCDTCGQKEERLARSGVREAGVHRCDYVPPPPPDREELDRLIQAAKENQLQPPKYEGRQGIWRRVGFPAPALRADGTYSYASR